MGPWEDEVGAYAHAMLYVLLRRSRGRHGCGYVKGEGRCQTCNMSYTHLVGDGVDVDVIGVVDVVDMIDAGFEVALDMEQDSRHLRPRNKGPHSILPLPARCS